MIKEFEFFHGVVFSRIFHEYNKNIKIKTYPTKSNSSYVVNDSVGVYIKYSSKRLSPWRFSFMKEHQDEILKMNNSLSEVFIIFVCNDDGIVCLGFEEFKQILNYAHNEMEWICLSRGAREKYCVCGKDGKLKLKIGGNEFPDKIFKLTEAGEDNPCWLK
jgi:hypothetical protein